MFNRSSHAGKIAARVIAFFSVVWLAACDTIPVTTSGGAGRGVNPNEAVTVALLVPGGSQSVEFEWIAESLENAARLAVNDLQGGTIDLRVYDTAGDPQMAAQAAVQAATDGAQIVVGPLLQSSVLAASNALAASDINMLAFSNNSTIAGGNVFLLGRTFDNAANRLVRYSANQGNTRIAIVHGETATGDFGSRAIETAALRSSAQIVAKQSYPPSQNGIASSVNNIVANIKQSGATATFLTATPSGSDAELPFILPALNSAGLNARDHQYLGLTDWSVNPQMFTLVSAQEGLFAQPASAMRARFENRFNEAYGKMPHELAGLAYDGVAAVGALLATGNADALSRQAITTPQGFRGTNGIFRFLPDGTNERALDIATIRNNQVVVIDPAPTSFGGAGL